MELIEKTVGTETIFEGRIVRLHVDQVELPKMCIRDRSFITKEDVAKKLFSELNLKYQTREGGYTRVVKIGPRRGDAAEMAIVQLV